MKRWEYRIETFYAIEPGTAADLANDLGAEGWELVTTDRQERWIFKRPVEEETVRPDSIPPEVSLEKRRVHQPASARRTRTRQLL
jgi:hypothetical protein